MIRRYIPSDESYVIDIWLKASLISHNFIPESYWYTNVEVLRTVYLPAAEVYVAIDDLTGAVTGFLALVDNYIAAVFVAPHQQGKGIGTTLIKKGKSLRKELTLKVYSRNNKATNFYLRKGFRIVTTGIDEATGEKEYQMQWGEKEVK